MADFTLQGDHLNQAQTGGAVTPTFREPAGATLDPGGSPMQGRHALNTQHALFAFQSIKL